MPRDSNGTYTLPNSNPVAGGTLIETGWANGTLQDIATQLNNVLTRDGLLGLTQPLRLVDGTPTLPGVCFNSAPGTGLWRSSTAAGFSFNGSTQWQVGASGMSVPVTIAGKAITLSDPIAQPNQAVTKSYVDGLVDDYLPLTGGTVTGPILLTNPGSSFSGWFRIASATNPSTRVHLRVEDSDGALTFWNSAFNQRMLRVDQGGGVFASYGFTSLQGNFNVGNPESPNNTSCEISFYRVGRSRVGNFYASNGDFGWWDDNLSGSRGVFNANGDLSVRGNVSSSSDDRLKKNFHAFKLNLDDVASLAIYTYDRSDTNRQQVGVKAQDLQKLIPLAVDEDSDGTLSVDYGRAALACVASLAQEMKKWVHGNSPNNPQIY